MLGVAAAMPDWLAHTPMGLTVRAINERNIADAALLSAGLVLQVGIIVWLGVRLLRHQLRHGVVAGGARESARDSRIASAGSAPARGSRISRLLSAVQRRELTLLSRDRNFLVQSLVIPLLIVGGQLVLGTSGVATSMWKDPNVLASVAFGLAAYSLSMSAFQTLNTEGHALWLLYTFPRSIEDVLKDKAKLWGVITLAYPAAMFAVGAVLAPALDWKFVGAMLTAFLGIPIYAFIAVALGIFGSNPLEQQQHHKVKPAYVYLYMSLSAPLRVRHRHAQSGAAPHLHGAVAAAGLRVVAEGPRPASLPARSRCFAAGARLHVRRIDRRHVVLRRAGSRRRRDHRPRARDRRRGTHRLLHRWRDHLRAHALRVRPGENRRRAAHPGRGNQPARAGHRWRPRGRGLRPRLSIRHRICSDCSTTCTRDNKSYIDLGLWVVPLGVIAAPIFEEFIFRGLIFGGLRRSFGVWPATLASAAVFAILHPPLAIVPVFVLGVCTALVYERTRSLLAPMIVHAVYNACVIGVPTLFV